MTPQLIEILSADEIRRTITRLASEVIEKSGLLPVCPDMADYPSIEGI